MGQHFISNHLNTLQLSQMRKWRPFNPFSANQRSFRRRIFFKGMSTCSFTVSGEGVWVGGGRSICQNREGGERGNLNATCCLAWHPLYCFSFSDHFYIYSKRVALMKKSIPPKKSGKLETLNLLACTDRRKNPKSMGTNLSNFSLLEFLFSGFKQRFNSVGEALRPWTNKRPGN